MGFAVGDKAKIAAPVPTGTIVDIQFDVKTGEKSVLLEWESVGAVHQRWFKEDELVEA